MATYIMLTTLTSDGAHTVHANPERLTAVNDDIAAFGCTVVAQYAVLGAYDFRGRGRGPGQRDDRAHLSVDLGSRGTARIQTVPAIPMQSLLDKLNGPAQLGR